MVESIVPLPQQKVVHYAPAHRFFASAIKLERMDGIGKKSDPFFEVVGTPPGPLSFPMFVFLLLKVMMSFA